MLELYKWSAIRNEGWDTLFLGNGASIAICERFAYSSLYEYAEGERLINDELRQIFTYFGTRDFEMILRLLWHTCLINSILGINERRTQNAYEDLRDALIRAVRDIHCDYSMLEDTLKKCANFAKNFHTIVSLNYDLTLYWIMMVGNDYLKNNPNDPTGGWFKDCFIHDSGGSANCTGLLFENDWERLREPYNAGGTTLVFYPHGSMILAVNRFGEEIKLKLEKNDRSSLRDKVLDCWNSGAVIPLFISEGNSTQKEKAIRRSVYLSTVYHEVLPNLGKSIVIFGWSFSDNDIHILRAILRNFSLKKLAISVYDENHFENFSSEVQRKINQVKQEISNKIEILFFRAQSNGCWTQADSL